MIYFTDAEIDQLINEDFPYFDITSLTVKIGTRVAKMSFTTSHNTLICGTEEVLKIFEKFKISPTLLSFSGEQIDSGIKFLEAEGLAANLHSISRTVTNLLEFASGIATHIKILKDIANEISPCIPILTSRKSIPFTRKIAAKAIRIGGGHIHQLNLSDAILITDNHIKFLGGIENFIKKIPEIKRRAAGRSIQIEVETAKNALALANTNIENLQIDKLKPDELKKLIPEIKTISPGLIIAAAGNINETNIADFASTGADMLVTSYPCYAKPACFLVNIDPVFDL
jgi:molybdenum transport protein